MSAPQGQKKEKIKPGKDVLKRYLAGSTLKIRSTKTGHISTFKDLTKK